MAKDNDLLSVPACAKLVGKHPPQLYKFINDEGMPSHKDDEGHVRVRLGEVQDFLKAREASPRSRGGAATQSATMTSKAEQYIEPFVKRPVLSLWDRGNDHGWAVAAISETPEVEYNVDEYTGQQVQHLVCFEVDYTKNPLVWPSSRVIEEVLDGKIVLAEPQAVLRLIAAQLQLFDPEDRPTHIIDQLKETAEWLDHWKDEKAIQLERAAK